MEQKNSRQIKFKRLKNQVKAVVTNPYNVIVLVAIVLLTYLIVLPLVDMLSTTFQLAQRDLRATGGTMDSKDLDNFIHKTLRKNIGNNER